LEDFIEGVKGWVGEGGHSSPCNVMRKFPYPQNVAPLEVGIEWIEKWMFGLKKHFLFSFSIFT